MARTYPIKRVDISASILASIAEKKAREGRLGSLTSYISEVLDGYAKGRLISEDLVRAKVEAELRPKIEEEIYLRLAAKDPGTIQTVKIRKDKRERKTA